ncbi:MAG: hypothetical protein CEE38_15390 [Planctomycetes bacterium B3_Pla]|nr:MAG: hypothetical protein CEE38_15390 [Planctomycetes bacterium B3_Pla]
MRLEQDENKKRRMMMMKYRNRNIETERRLVTMAALIYPTAKLRHSHVERRAGHDYASPRSGFTIVELIIVVMIIAIAALVAIPMMSSAASVQIRSASNMIAGDLEYARSMAISRGQKYSMVFDPGVESYKIVDEAGIVIKHPVKTSFDYIVDFKNDGRLNKVDIANANFNATTSVQFDCLGSPDSGGTVGLQAGTTTVTITVEHVTGYVSIN